jgi:hypothetical protein
LIHTLLRQFISYLPPDRRGEINPIFLRTLFNDIFTGGQQPIARGDPPEIVVRKLLDASSGELCSALGKALDAERERTLCIVISELEQPGSEFVVGMNFLITRGLRKRPSMQKILLTSRPQAAIKEVLNGLPFIEYDKERKGLAYYHKTLSNSSL